MPAPLEFRIDDLRGPEIISLLEAHIADMRRISPPGCAFVLDLDALRAPGLTFWSVWRDAALVGCGALQELDPRHGEIKSMRTCSHHLRQGVAAALLEHLLQVARERGYRRLSLETGGTADFAPAHALYARFGFTRCGPFGEYLASDFNIFLTREIDEGDRRAHGTTEKDPPA